MLKASTGDSKWCEMKSDIIVEGLHALLLSTAKKLKVHYPMRLEKIFKTCQRKAVEYNTNLGLGTILD